MDTSIIQAQLPHCLVDTAMPSLGKKYRGKVRDTYAVGDRLVLVTTDRISAFDHVLGQPIPFKGQVLNRLAAWFFAESKDIVPNHLLDVPDANVSIVRRCEAFPVEFVVRGYLAGHGWREYKAGRRTLCGRRLPEGLSEGSRLPEPILTPATKAAEGHDEDISRAEILRRGLLDEETFQQVESYALALFRRGTEMAGQRGLLLVDTKYEFGRDSTGRIVLIDEVHTPDSSRYYYASTYAAAMAAGRPQRQLSKEFVREWLMKQGFDGTEGQMMPVLTDDFRVEVSRRYVELFETLTGLRFQPDTHPDPAARVETSLEEYFSPSEAD